MPYPSFDIEDTYDKPVCGIDEVGRGPLAGPVVAAAVLFKPDARQSSAIYQINDSKKLSAAKRRQFCKMIYDTAVVGIGQASVEEIDHHNILQATFLAMQRAYAQIEAQANDTPPGMALIDGNKSPKLNCLTRPIVKGDQISLSIAAASIIAKEHRDAHMTELSLQHPMYDWHKNAGYGTKFHMDALKLHGITPHHRKSFKPIHELISTTY